MGCNTGPGPRALQLLGSGHAGAGNRREVWFLNARFPRSAWLWMSALLPPLCAHRSAPGPGELWNSLCSPRHLGCAGHSTRQQPRQVCGNVPPPFHSRLLRFLAKISWFVVVGPKLLLPLPSARCVKIPKQQPKASPSTGIKCVGGKSGQI